MTRRKSGAAIALRRHRPDQSGRKQEGPPKSPRLAADATYRGCYPTSGLAPKDLCLKVIGAALKAQARLRGEIPVGRSLSCTGPGVTADIRRRLISSVATGVVLMGVQCPPLCAPRVLSGPSPMASSNQSRSIPSTAADTSVDLPFIHGFNRWTSSGLPTGFWAPSSVPADLRPRVCQPVSH